MILTVTPSVTWIIVWGVVFVLALVIELLTVQLVSIWGCGGAIASLILAVCGVPYYYQLVTFVLVTAICLILCKVLYRPKNSDKKTNYDALIGSDIIVTDDVSLNHPGSGQVRDVIWTIKVEEDILIEKGELATVLKINGNHLVVEPKKEIIE